MQQKQGSPLAEIHEMQVKGWLEGEVLKLKMRSADAPPRRCERDQDDGQPWVDELKPPLLDEARSGALIPGSRQHVEHGLLDEAAKSDGASTTPSASARSGRTDHHSRAAEG